MKELLSSDQLPVHFNPSQQLVLACDASPYGLGAVLSHKIDGGGRLTYCIPFEISGLCRETILYKLTDYLYQKSLPNIENRVKECIIYQQPSRSHSTLGLAFEALVKNPFGLHRKMNLILIDAHSKWIEVKMINCTTSTATIKELCSSFSTHGLPDIISSDNGAAFSSSEFVEYTKLNGICHVRTAPYHPASNSQAERAVKNFKEYLKEDWH